MVRWVLLMDNSWATVTDWDKRVATAERLISEAEQQNLPVSIVFSADRAHDATPDTASKALERLRAAVPRTLRSDDISAIEALTTAFHGQDVGTLAIISDGIAEPNADHAWKILTELEPMQVMLFEDDGAHAIALTSAANDSDGFSLSALRLDTEAQQDLAVTARDGRGRPIATGSLHFDAGSADGKAALAVPFELRNDFAEIVIDSEATAGATYLLDDSFRRRRVALLSAEPLDLNQPLLSPLYYLTRALEPFADLVVPENQELSGAIDEILEQRPSVIVMADIGTLPDEAEKKLTRWIDTGGMLVRFAGPRLASGIGDDQLVPVKLRHGERSLGGSLSWSEPQPLAEFPDTGPFAGMARPTDVTVNTQVLAEPSPDLAAHTWASLLDGTPLVTSREQGSGRIVLFHVTAEATWSTLPLSGQFVEMLRRSILLSRATDAAATDGRETTLPPYQLLNVKGVLVPPAGGAQPLKLVRGETPRVTPDNPPGLYGTEEGFLALNLMQPGDSLDRFLPPDFTASVSRAGFTAGKSRDLAPFLLSAALLLLIVDGIIVLAMAGAFSLRGLRRPAATAAILLAGALVLSALPFDRASADDFASGRRQDPRFARPYASCLCPDGGHGRRRDQPAGSERADTVSHVPHVAGTWRPGRRGSRIRSPGALFDALLADFGQRRSAIEGGHQQDRRLHEKRRNGAVRYARRTGRAR